MSEEGTPTPPEGGTPTPPEGGTPTPPSAGAALNAPPAGGAPDTSGQWFDSFSDGDKTYISSKGWDKEGRGVADVLKSYQSLEKLHGAGADKLMTIPDPENAEEMTTFHTRMGVPEEAAGYGTEGFDVSGTPVDISVLQGMSHAMKHSPAQHAQFMESVTEFLGSSIQESHDRREARDTAEQTQLTKDWGQAAEANTQAAGKAASRFGVDAAGLDKIQEGLGYRATMELFTKIGNAFGEGKAPDPSTTDITSFGLTPSVAKTRIEELKRDSGFRDRLLNGDREAKEQWDNLKKVAFSG